MISLRSQVALVAVILTGTGLLLFGSLLQMINMRLEASLLDTLVNNEAEFFESLIVPDQPVPAFPVMAQTSTWYDRGGHGHTPQALRALPLGMSHDVAHDGGRYHVLRRQLAQGVLTVALEMSDLKAKEAQFNRLLLLSGLTILLLTGVLSYWLSGLASRPFFRLSKQIDELEVRGGAVDVDDSARSREARTIAQALNRYLAQLNAAMTREQRFAAAASHEFRSPLTVIGGSLELMAANADLSSTAQRALTRALHAHRELVETTQALLTLARDEYPEVIDSIDLVIASQAYIEDLASQASSQTARISADWPAMSVCQSIPESHWRILLGNLLRNALQHAPTGTIRLSLSAQSLCIEDEGPGVDEGALNDLFLPGVRSPSSEGAGLGLYIVAELARRHAWHVKVSNRQPQGLRVQLNFNEGTDT